MATERDKTKRLVICPECDTENDLEKQDECSKCGINLEVLVTKHRYNRALKKLQEREDQENPAKKRRATGWNPFE